MNVTLRPVVEADLEVLEQEATDPALSSPFNWFGPRPADEIRAQFARDAFAGEEGGRLMVQLGRRSDPAAVVVGTLGWRAVSYGPVQGSHAWSIGITLWPGHRGRGIGRVAQRLMADHLFATTRAHRVEASTDVDNIAEQRALAAAGFVREGVLRGAQLRDGAWHDLVLFSRLRSD